MHGMKCAPLPPRPSEVKELCENTFACECGGVTTVGDGRGVLNWRAGALIVHLNALVAVQAAILKRYREQDSFKAWTINDAYDELQQQIAEASKS